jgi:MSHA biogenesis protein MshJ
MQPLRERQAALRDETHKVLDQIEEFGRQEEQIRRAYAADPDRPLRVRADDLTEQIAILDERIRQHTATLVPPREMAIVLEEVLRREGTLRLTRLEYLGAEPVLEPSEVGARSGAGIRRHRFEIELRGSYLPTLTYVRALEDLPWAFFWEALEYRIDEHPVGTAIIRVFTLGPEEGWVGA